MQNSPSPVTLVNRKLSTHVNFAQDAELEQVANDFQWLYDARLPTEKSSLKKLIDLFFSRVHQLRCTGFIHPPSFMHSFDRGTLVEDYGDALIYIICAFGARCLYIDDTDRQRHAFSGVVPGRQWADRAEDLVLEGIKKPSLDNLMAMVLVCDYGFVADNYEVIFQLVGCCYRLVRLLGLDDPSHTVVPRTCEEATRYESQRRLVWSCFILDQTVGSGVEPNLNWQTYPPIPLPLSDHDFLSQVIPDTSSLPTMEIFDDPAMSGRLNMRAHIVHIFWLRGQVLKMLRKHRLSTDPWISGSEFLSLIDRIGRWYQNLPENLLLDETRAYIHKEMNVLSSIFFLHLGYHLAVTDLTRVALPGFNFPLANAFRNAPGEFRAQVQRRARYHADEVTRIIRLGLSHADRAFEDAFCYVAAFEATKIQIVDTAVAGITGHTKERRRIEEDIRTNIRLISRKGRDATVMHRRTLMPLLTRFGFHSIALEWGQSRRSSPTTQGVDITGPDTANHLSAISILRLARSKMEERAASASSPSETATSEASRTADLSRQPPIIFGASPTTALHQGSSPSGSILHQQQHQMAPIPNILDSSTLPVIHAHHEPIPMYPEDQSFFQGDFADLGGSPMETLSPGSYMRLADEMSEFLTWGRTASEHVWGGYPGDGLE
ncbi:uncharacterized protein E0L32_007975 [Thyridium curvatum]|uniref:Xylanolytic transcriptional activator regulatory domain-containing protein n=1 Tax=Thyridium curvatum TaxID=1093900 RepID=A0A507AXC8_9PEZI|nr:uncharacterized protein E0L32_007975 [Thyridium curvatum]TPX11114.1 hypothetical protein E0L32_007975 [Thyridium curvatum]